jgi:hypothetical protein
MTERKVFTFKDLEEAHAFIGKLGIFSENYKNAYIGHGARGRLKMIDSYSSSPFITGSVSAQFFSPDPELVEKIVPFTVEDWQMFKLRVVRRKSDQGFTGQSIVAWSHIYVAIGGEQNLVYYQDLLKDWEFDDSSPCGKEVEE